MFTNRFIKSFYQNKDKNQFRVAIDHSRIVPKDYANRIMEFDGWYGPLFDKSKLDDPKAIGLTVIQRSKDYMFDLDKTLERTEFLWTYAKNIKTIQIEEISSKTNDYGGMYLNKYCHAERNIINNKFQHFDGAVNVYYKNNYDLRTSTTLNYSEKSSKKIKLFRIDGDIDSTDWTDLTSFFYKGNEMIIKYFDPITYKNKYGVKIKH